MAAAEPLVVVAVAIAFLLAAAAAAAAAPLPGGSGGLPFPLLPADPGAGCRGPVGTCPAGDEAPRISARPPPWRSTSIPYVPGGQHQRRDSVPCSRRGASYYNCRPGAPASPYSHACSRIKHCRG
ncbi:Protein RALF-like 1 [Zea mays]|uniref:Protein RALF-like 1 n=1 Tax=Zea mays TaxID=4577 RepID=A0A3L6F890_MAIZE|nr:Protein RALF-like 1 [Zea mays]